MVKAFNLWDVEGIEVKDLGLKGYITLQPRVVPMSGARYAGSKFHKSRVFIVERLINKLMVTGHKGGKHVRTSYKNSGKAYNCYMIVQEAFKQVEKKTGKNPIEVFVKGLENAAPREEVITIEYGGARYPKAVEVSPQRRVDMALRYTTQATYAACFNTKKTAVQALVEEIIGCYNSDSTSAAIAKKNELERQSDASR